MSGGHFDYRQSLLGDIADSIEHLIETNDSEELDDWGSKKGYGFKPETIEKFKETAYLARRLREMIDRVDWLVSGDDGEETFHKRWKDQVPPPQISSAVEKEVETRTVNLRSIPDKEKMTKKFKGFSYEDGRIVPTAYADGYWFGDQLLEGVAFKITVQEGGSLKAEMVESGGAYEKKLNKEYWESIAVEYASRLDIFYETASLGGEDLALEEMEES